MNREQFAKNQAFPVEGTPENYFAPGMTKREMFAMAAMQGILSGNHPICKEWNPDQLVAKAAAEFADALIAELNKETP